MEQDVENEYRTVCSTCLSSDRDLFALNTTNVPQAFQIFKLLMYDFAGDSLGEIPEISHLICWECLAIMKRFYKFKWQVHNAQEHFRVLLSSQTQETIDHTYMSQSLSSLAVETKTEYDKILFEYTTVPDCQFTLPQPVDDVKNELLSLRDSIGMDVEEHILDVPTIGDKNTQVFSHVVLGADTLVSVTDVFGNVKSESMPRLTIAPMTAANIEAGTVILSTPIKEDNEPKLGYITEYMTSEEMVASREQAKKKVQYASSVYKCELCAIGFYTQQQVEEHFESSHKPKPGLVACKICYVYIQESALTEHVDKHYLRFTCKMCSHTEYSLRMMEIHIKTHRTKQLPNAVIKIEGTETKKSKKKKKAVKAESPQPGDLRKLLSKTTIEGYKCLECDMFFKNSRARKNHVARFHREGLQCDHCKKRFVNRTTLATHLRLHEGPLPREECPICHKLVRSIQIKYHIQRHKSKSKYECGDCNKIFSHLATYQAHLRYSRAHADENVFKFPCPMCNKGYPTKEAMQDHFNYQHLGKTSHKCPICDKPIASRANVEKHISRVHGEKKQRPRNHQCQTCGKSFTDKKALTQHEVIHSGARPLSCDICHQTFKQKASLYTHRKRVHKVCPAKKEVHYIHELTA